MANYIPIEDETNLGGVLVSALNANDGAGATFTAKFFDTKTGEQRTPRPTTTTLIVNKDSSKAERIRVASYSTDSDGITTVTLASSNPRSLPMYGTGAGSATGNRHDPGSPIGSVTHHEGVSQLNTVMAGTASTGASAIRIGDETDVDVFFYAQNGDANIPYIGYDASADTWVFSNDGVSSTVIGSGASSYSGGDGIDITASVVSIDLTDSNKFTTTTAADKAVVTTSSGVIDISLIQAAPLATYISDVTVSAEQINNSVGALQMNIEALEDIDGSTTPQLVSYGSQNMMQAIKIYNGGSYFNTVGTLRNFGDSDTTTRQGQSFIFTDAMADSIKVNELTLWIKKIGTPTDNLTVEIYSDSSGSPDASPITNGISNSISGSSLDGSIMPVKFSWATPPSLTSGSTYWIVIRRSGSNDAVNYYQVLDAAGDYYADGERKEYTASTGLWAAATNDLQIQLCLAISYGGKICKCDADDVLKSNAIGFIIDNVSATSNGTVYPSQFINFTGLQDGANYVADKTTSGAIILDTSTPIATNIDAVAPHIIAGRAFASGILGATYKKTVINSFSLDPSSNFTDTSNGTLDLFVPVGFRPDEIFIKYHYTDDSAANKGNVVQTRYYGSTEVGDMFIGNALAASTSSGTNLDSAGTGSLYGFGKTGSTIVSTAVTLQKIYDNAVLIRLKLDATADRIYIQQMEFTKY